MPKPTNAWFGQQVMKWGTDPAVAHARRETLTLQELKDSNVTLEIAKAWRDCYFREYIRTDRSNDNALFRAYLMDRAVELLGGDSEFSGYLQALHIG